MNHQKKQKNKKKEDSNPFFNITWPRCKLNDALRMEIQDIILSSNLTSFVEGRENVSKYFWK
jgi:hypothetical protein